MKLRLSELRGFPTTIAVSALRAVGSPPTAPTHAYAVLTVRLGRFCPVPCYAMLSEVAKPVAPANTVYSWRGHGGLCAWAVDGAVVSPQGPTVLEVAVWVRGEGEGGMEGAGVTCTLRALNPPSVCVRGKGETYHGFTMKACCRAHPRG